MSVAEAANDLRHTAEQTARALYGRDLQSVSLQGLLRDLDRLYKRMIAMKKAMAPVLGYDAPLEDLYAMAWFIYPEKENDVLCGACYASVSDKAEQCPFCQKYLGKKIAEVEVEVEAAPEAPNHNPPSEPPEENLPEIKKKKRKRTKKRVLSRISDKAMRWERRRAAAKLFPYSVTDLEEYNWAELRVIAFAIGHASEPELRGLSLKDLRLHILAHQPQEPVDIGPMPGVKNIIRRKGKSGKSKSN